MPKLPYIAFYTGEWKKDPKLSLCSPASRGIWIDLICSLHDDQVCSITGTCDQLARVCRCTPVEMNDAISELQITQAADITQRGKFFTITCRRMKKAMEISSLRSAAAKQRFSKPHANTQQIHEDEGESEVDSPRDPGGGLARGATANCGFASAERPSEAEVTAHAAVIGLAEWRAKDWFHEMEGCGWLDHNKRPIAKWQAVLNRVRTKWESDGRPSGPPAAKSSGGGVNRPMNAMELKTIIAAKGVIADKLKNLHCSETGLGTSWNSDDARKKWKKLREEIRDLNEKLAGLA